MKKVFFMYGALFLLLLQFTSCLSDKDNNDRIFYFYDEPVVVEKLGAYPFVRNGFYSFYTPGLTDNTVLKEGDLLWSAFIVDLDDKDYPSVLSTFAYTAKHFKYDVVESANVVIPENAEEFQSTLNDDYSDPIESAVLYGYAIDSLWFVGLKHKVGSNKLHYTYQLVLNPEIEQNSRNNFPTLYIGAKQVNDPDVNQAKDENRRNVFAFNVADFVNFYRKEISQTGPVRFNLKYKTGVDSNGKDIYRAFLSNPISWNFNSAKPK